MEHLTKPSHAQSVCACAEMQVLLQVMIRIANTRGTAKVPACLAAAHLPQLMLQLLHILLHPLPCSLPCNGIRSTMTLTWPLHVQATFS